MQTEYIEIKNNNAAAAITRAAQLIRAGGIVAFPTETVYGLGANALNPTAVAKIFEAKGRPNDNPLIVHIADLAGAERVAVLNPLAYQLAEIFWPGPLTMILPRQTGVPDCVTAGLDTVGIRMPKNEIALSLIRAAGLPIAAPSANLSGKPSPTCGAHVYHDLRGKIALVLEGGAVEVGLESTVLDLSGAVPCILRPGAITAEDLQPYCGEVQVGGILQNAGDTPTAPGMKYRHYAPNGQVEILAAAEIPARWQQLDATQRLALVSSQTAALLDGQDASRIYDLGDRDNLEQIAHNIFAALRYADDLSASMILVEAFPEQGIGSAIMNRLSKASIG